MDRKEIFDYIPVIVLLALLISVSSEFCFPTIPQEQSSLFIQQPHSYFNIFCYTNSFSPEAPEIQPPYSQTTTTTSSLATITSSEVVGTAVSTTTTL